MDLSKLFYSFAANLPTAVKDPFLVLEEPYILYPYTAGFNIVVVFIKNKWLDVQHVCLLAIST